MYKSLTKYIHDEVKHPVNINPVNINPEVGGIAFTLNIEK